MKVVLIDHYDESSSPHKDPISIPRGLTSHGVQVELVSRRNFTGNSLYGFRIHKLEEWILNGLINEPPDCVIAISRFDPALTSVLRVIKSRNIPLIIKGDTDGTLGYPLSPNYLRTKPIIRNPLNALRHLKWRFPLQYFVGQRVDHIKLADLVIYESPGAGVNLFRILQFWGLHEYYPKLLHIPNSISNVYTDAVLEEKLGCTIVTVGRWDDELCKGSDLLAGTITKVLQERADIDFVVIGNNSEYVCDRLPDKFKSRVNFTGAMDYSEVKLIVANARIMLVTSRLESFSLVAAEALCVGTSLAVTPIESLIYLSGGGAYGSVARDFSVLSITTALMHEIHQWKIGHRRSTDIASYWRNILNEDTISIAWFDVVNKLVHQ